MECRHEHQQLKTVGDRLFCKACGQELPLEFLTHGDQPAEEPKAEKQTEKQTEKPSVRKRTAKKAE